MTQRLDKTKQAVQDLTEAIKNRPPPKPLRLSWWRRIWYAITPWGG